MPRERARRGEVFPSRVVNSAFDLRLTETPRLHLSRAGSCSRKRPRTSELDDRPRVIHIRIHRVWRPRWGLAPARVRDCRTHPERPLVQSEQWDESSQRLRRGEIGADQQGVDGVGAGQPRSGVTERSEFAAVSPGRSTGAAGSPPDGRTLSPGGAQPGPQALLSVCWPAPYLLFAPSSRGDPAVRQTARLDRVRSVAPRPAARLFAVPR